MERWNDGVMERWNDGVMERWNDGVMARWSAGALERPNNEPSALFKGRYIVIAPAGSVGALLLPGSLAGPYG
jgi:hypothetical protein